MNTSVYFDEYKFNMNDYEKFSYNCNFFVAVFMC